MGKWAGGEGIIFASATASISTFTSLNMIRTFGRITYCSESFSKVIQTSVKTTKGSKNKP
jgi:hypothetical protein